MAAGAVIGGILRNLTGDFNVTILASLTLSGIGVAAIYLLPNTSQHLLPDWEEALPQEARSSA
jgi:multidrug efflux pump subunit AcrB